MEVVCVCVCVYVKPCNYMNDLKFISIFAIIYLTKPMKHNCMFGKMSYKTILNYIDLTYLDLNALRIMNIQCKAMNIQWS